MQPTYFVKHPDNSYSEADPQPALLSESYRRYRYGEPFEHPGCLNHVSHPCEGCGRIAGKTPNVKVTGAEPALSAERPVDRRVGGLGS